MSLILDSFAATAVAAANLFFSTSPCILAATETFTRISVRIADGDGHALSDVRSALDAYMKPEVLTGKLESKRAAVGCASPEGTTLTHVISQKPEILCVQLQRTLWNKGEVAPTVLTHVVRPNSCILLD